MENKTINIIKNFYIIYSFYIILLVNATNLMFLQMLPALVLMWILYFVFYLGTISNVTILTIYGKNILDYKYKHNLKYIYYVSVVTLIFSYLVVKFYTGQTLFTVLDNLINNYSTYYIYQTYFNENELHMLTMQKLPYVFMLFFIKFTLYYYSIIYIIKNNFVLKQKISLLMIIISFLYFSISRGTTYEIFDLSLIIIYVVTNKYYNDTYSLSSMYLLYLFIICIATYIFYINLGLRSSELDYYISHDVYYDKDALLSQFSTGLSFITILLYGYFGHGFFYTSYYFMNVWFISIETFMLGLIPFGFNIKNDTSIMAIMKDFVDQGARWHPDTVIFINNFGFIGLIIMCYLLGLLFRNIYQNGTQRVFSHITLFFIILQMISLPVGNFVITSSSNKLILVVMIFYWINKLIFNIKFNFKLL